MTSITQGGIIKWLEEEQHREKLQEEQLKGELREREQQLQKNVEDNHNQFGIVLYFIYFIFIWALI